MLANMPERHTASSRIWYGGVDSVIPPAKLALNSRLKRALLQLFADNKILGAVSNAHSPVKFDEKHPVTIGGCFTYTPLSNASDYVRLDYEEAGKGDWVYVSKLTLTVLFEKGYDELLDFHERFRKAYYKGSHAELIKELNEWARKEDRLYTIIYEDDMEDKD